MSYNSKSTDESPNTGDLPSAFVDETPDTFVDKEPRAKGIIIPVMGKAVGLGMRLNASKAVKFFRSSAVIILAGSTILLSTVTFTMSNKQEHSDFEMQVSGSARSCSVAR
jgi:hypothetical protein